MIESNRMLKKFTQEFKNRGGIDMTSKKIVNQAKTLAPCGFSGGGGY